MPFIDLYSCFIACHSQSSHSRQTCITKFFKPKQEPDLSVPKDLKIIEISSDSDEHIPKQSIHLGSIELSSSSDEDAQESSTSLQTLYDKYSSNSAQNPTSTWDEYDPHHGVGYGNPDSILEEILKPTQHQKLDWNIVNQEFDEWVTNFPSYWKALLKEEEEESMPCYKEEEDSSDPYNGECDVDMFEEEEESTPES